MNTIYETERLCLKILDERDAAIVLDYYQRNEEFHREWVHERPKSFFSLEYTQMSLKQDCYNIENGDLLRLWLFHKEDVNFEKTLGTLSFSNIVRGAFLSCFLGYMMDKNSLNKGYMTEAIEKGIEIIFEEYGLHRIEANIMPHNRRSLRVAHKLGFFMEGISPKYLHINGNWEDHVHMVLLNKNMK